MTAEICLCSWMGHVGPCQAFGDRYYVAMQEGCRDVSSGKYGITNVGQMYNEEGSSKMQVLSLNLIWARCFFGGE